MSADAWVTLAVVVIALGAMATDRLAPSYAMLASISVLLVTGVLETDEAFAGFSNPAPLSVAALYVLVGAAEHTGMLEHLTGRLLGTGEGGSDRGRLLRITATTGGFSAFLNSTPIVGMVAPAVASWARRTGRPSSRFLMPISFAAVLGGLVTLIGTSTNLVVSGLMEAAGLEPMGMFEITTVGLPIAVVGILVVVLLAPRMLPERHSPGQQASEGAREFTVEMEVAAGSPLIGGSVAEAGLRNLEGVYLVEVERGGRRIAPVRPDSLLEEGDRLVFVGNIRRVLDLQRIRGLIPAAEQHFKIASEGAHGRFYEAVVAPGSPLLGSTLKEVGFRSRYGGAVIAVHRAGERISGKLGDITIHGGDVLLVLAGPRFRARWHDRRDFLAIVTLGGAGPVRREKAGIVGVVSLGLIVVVATGVLDILPAAMVAAFALIATRVLTPSEARAAIDLEVVIAIAASFGLGAAVAGSGLASSIADGITGIFEGAGDIGILIGVLAATMVLTEVVSNNAAAVLMFPIGIAAAVQGGMDPRPFAMAVAVGASASFLFPIGYQTNMIVYGLGGYRFGDFARLGVFLNIVVLPVALLVIPQAWPLR